jgi:hypothetical protein
MKTHRYDPVYFLSRELLPRGFEYPESYRKFAALGQPRVGAINEDWIVLDRECIERFVAHVRDIAPALPLVPFMRRNGEDGIACFGPSSSGLSDRIYVVRYSDRKGCGGGTLSFEDWLALIPRPDPEDDV